MNLWKEPQTIHSFNSPTLVRHWDWHISTHAVQGPQSHGVQVGQLIPHFFEYAVHMRCLIPTFCQLFRFRPPFFVTLHGLWCRSNVHTPHASLAWRLCQRISTVKFTSRWASPACWPIRPILGFCGSKVHKNLWFLPWTPMNHRAKCDAASFILGGEIHIRTNTHTHKNKQTASDISTPCLSACVDNQCKLMLWKLITANYWNQLKNNLAAKNLIDRSRLLQCTFFDHLLPHLLHEQHECIQRLLDVWQRRSTCCRWRRRLWGRWRRRCHGNWCSSTVRLPCLTIVVVGGWRMTMVFWNKRWWLPATGNNTSLYSVNITPQCCISLLQTQII